MGTVPEQNTGEGSGFWNSVQENWHLPVGIISGYVAGSWAIGSTIGKLGEGTWWESACNIVGGLIGAVGGVFGMSWLTGDDRAREVASDVMNNAGEAASNVADAARETVERGADIASDALEQLTGQEPAELIDGLTDQILESRDATIAFIQNLPEMTEDLAADIYTELDGLDGAVGDGIAPSVLPQAREVISQRIVGN